ncbi:DUF4377 domain-containing protein [Aurantiacibacter sp. D1-12]|uniref:DUF4377 domain-containing protein n=1 Tax=Aurantiacibacter sp. D1-12 TaxID=2993658 RepID=UPI00237C9F22|nr:DUF4377 domain-containing protein [Aurantiacibacter sp. D1-12]MDE1466291.1 DUF4377 domain-containing protein [Aurantiacibacter sp. D1-12]
MSSKLLLTIIAAGLCAGCANTGNAGAAKGNFELFEISAHSVPCEGVGPMRCLIVNDELFYDAIEGYEHVEGQSASICVERARRPAPVPADASLYTYRRVPCE